MDADTLLAFGAATGLFARLFGPGLDAGLLRRCAANHVVETWPVALEDAEARAALAMMGAALNGLDEDGPDGEALDAIGRDNAALFVGPDKPVPMWESVWTTRERLLYADCTEEVRRAFAEAGFEAPNPDHEPADHLANELAFLSALLARTAAALDKGDEAGATRLFDAAASFFDNHPGRWAALCLAEVGRRAGTDFYRGAARLAAATLTALQGVLAGVA